jgi:hypothetical protein
MAGSLSIINLQAGWCSNSEMACETYIKWLAAYDAAMYSASQVLRATQDWRFEDHEIVALKTLRT